MANIPQVIFHGTQNERVDLTNAIAHNCACTFGEMGEIASRCEPHKALLTEQRFVDGLLFARRIADCLRRREFGTG